MHYPWPEPGTPISDIPTPMPVIDEAVLEDNIVHAAQYMKRIGKDFRPHIKTHKIPALAQQQIAAGATGINCQKITEAEVFADAGIDDILITYNILSSPKLDRLKTLNARIDKLTVVADNISVIEGLAANFDPSRPLRVMVECDTGGGRCGVQSPDMVVDLAERISLAPGLTFMGLMTYPTAGGAAQTEAFFSTAMRLLDSKGIPCPVRSNGGTPNLYQSHLVPSATEHRAGTYIYNDRSMVRAGHRDVENVAMTILATVVSRPTSTRAVLDSGSKALTSDLLGFRDYGLIVGAEDARIVSLSEEHAVVDLESHHESFPQVGQVVHIIPNHTCAVSNLFDRMIFHRDGMVTRVEPVAARGMVW